jgi:pyrroloquinoline quinone biosynthesis protein D
MSMIDLNSRPALAAHVRLQIDPVSDEPVLLFPEGVLVLNPTAHDIVLHCNGKASVHEIVAALSDEYEVDEATLRADAVECLADLLTRNLIVVQS